jgi:hypothetical protein
MRTILALTAPAAAATADPEKKKTKKRRDSKTERSIN